VTVPVICGPTGAGKTDVAAAICARNSLDIVSADSRQVYQGLAIGTAQPGPELRARVRFHLIDDVEPSRTYSAAEFARDAAMVIERLRGERRGFVVVGGSGLYLRALFEPFFAAPPADPTRRAELAALPLSALYERLRRLDPQRAGQLHPNDRQRIVRALEVFESTGKTFEELRSEAAAARPFRPRYLVLSMPRDLLYRRIDERFDAMMAAGLLDEVRRLKAAGLGRTTWVANAYGYAELLDHLAGRLELAEAVRLAKAKTRAYARRQLAWFRGLAGAAWFEYEGDVTAVAARLEPIVLHALPERV
jgi:tRNA dimethylallyltransferase